MFHRTVLELHSETERQDSAEHDPTDLERRFHLSSNQTFTVAAELIALACLHVEGVNNIFSN